MTTLAYREPTPSASAAVFTRRRSVLRQSYASYFGDILAYCLQTFDHVEAHGTRQQNSGNGKNLASFRSSAPQPDAFWSWKATRTKYRCFFAYTLTHPPTSRTPKFYVVSNIRARKASIYCNAACSDFPVIRRSLDDNGKLRNQL
jgi:hypothetical protein